MKMYFLLNMVIFQCHVHVMFKRLVFQCHLSFQGCTSSLWERLGIDSHLSNEKKPGWLFGIGDYTIHLLYMGIIINHYYGSLLNSQYNGKYSKRVFFVAHLFFDVTLMASSLPPIPTKDFTLTVSTEAHRSLKNRFNLSHENQLLVDFYG